MTKAPTPREALLRRLKSYEEEVASGRHVPPPGLREEAIRRLAAWNAADEPPPQG